MIYVVLVCAGLVACICTILALHPDYESGLFGNLALGLLGIAGYARLAAGYDFLAGAAPETTVQYTWIGIMIWTGLAIFLARHYVRFLFFNQRRKEEQSKRDQRSVTGNTEGMVR